ncbi:hypothetical protein PRO82_002254 [Candidatus Protochlamydia amoebophila]|nr:hypothetical protein [Candidatus Protochlamydia amoebophila]
MPSSLVSIIQVEVLALFCHDQLTVYSISVQKTSKNHLHDNII